MKKKEKRRDSWYLIWRRRSCYLQLTMVWTFLKLMRWDPQVGP